MVSAGDEPLEAKEFRELVLRDEADEARRNDVRRPEGEKRERMELNREVCILTMNPFPDRIFPKMLGAIETDFCLEERERRRVVKESRERLYKVRTGELSIKR